MKYDRHKELPVGIKIMAKIAGLEIPCKIIKRIPGGYKVAIRETNTQCDIEYSDVTRCEEE